MQFQPGTLLTTAPAAPLSPGPSPLSSASPRASAPDWRAHLLTESPHATLPDGTLLRLTASGIDLFERLTGGSYIPQDFHESTILLWCATRPPEELEALWIPAPPEDTEAPDSASLIPIYNIPGIMRRVIRWRDATIPAGARLEVHRLALALWNHEHGTLLEVDEAGIPDVPDAEKKSPSAAPTGSSPPSTPSPAETPPVGPISSTPSPIAPSSPPTAHGSSPTASPSSPPLPETAGTGSSTPSSPVQSPPSIPSTQSTQSPQFIPGATCEFCIPGVDNCYHAPDNVPFWVAEITGRIPTIYATGRLTGANGDQITSDIHEARHFADMAACEAWIHTSNRPAAWVPREHMCCTPPPAIPV